jgi:hypothetical protein
MAAVTIQKLYDIMLKVGQKNDPRSQKELDAMMKDRKKAFDKLDKKKKLYFNEESLVNPYGDSGVQYGEMKRKIKTAMVCIDADKQEVVLANALKGSKNEVDMIITHHPEGRALVDLTKVMNIQESVMSGHGVPINIVEKLLSKRVTELDRGLHPINHYQPIDAARLLDMPYMCCHTPADNSVHNFMEAFVAKREKKMKTVGDLMDAFLDIEEFQEAEKMGMGPMIFAGSPSSKLGKVAVTGMTGGTSGNDDIFEQLSRAGVGTVISMHMGAKPREKAEKHHLNVVITGHMASDSLGMNLVLDHMEKAGLKIVPAGGFIRVKRKA